MRFQMLVAILFAVTLAVPANAADKLVLDTENYPPYQTKDDKGVVSGENVKTLTELFKRSGIAIEFKMDTWQKSYETARTTAGHGVFTTTRTPEREALFRWVGPLSVNRWVLLAKASNKIKIKKLEDAFVFKVGGVKEDVKTSYLEKLGAKVDAVADGADRAEVREGTGLRLVVRVGDVVADERPLPTQFAAVCHSSRTPKGRGNIRRTRRNASGDGPGAARPRRRARGEIGRAHV